MKNKILFIVFVCLGVFPSCSESFLELSNPNEQTTGDYWKTPEELQKGIDACYRALRFNGEYSRWLHILYVARSDEGYSHSPNAYFQAYSNFKIGSYNDDSAEAVFYTWLDNYKGIFWANQVLDNAPNIQMDETLRDRIMGEAYFLRGLQYFNLAGVFGRGPITLTSYAREDAPVIGEQEDLYNQALKDFKDARDRLPEKYSNSSDLGRATKGSALGMMVKVLMQQHNWVEAETVCREIFNLKIYKLVDNYTDNFTAINENNSESLFEVQYAYGIQAGNELGCNRAKFMGLPVDGCSWDDSTPRTALKGDFEQEKTTDGKVDPRLKATLAFYDASTPDEKFYGKTWTQWGLDQNNIYWRKYTNWDTQTYEDYNSGINFRVVRLADIYLLYAEALNELNRTSEAYDYINKVRNRVGLCNLENSKVYTDIGNDKEKMREQIMHERMTELCGESWRWLDLERWGYFESAEKIAYLKSRDDDFSNFKIGVHNRFPIPYREIPLVEGLTQNPGY